MAYKTENIKKWTRYDFQDVEFKVGPDFNRFVKDFKNEILAQISEYPELQLLKLLPGYFYVSGFLSIEGTDELIYFSTPDVRNPGFWADHILFRRAENDQDFKGDINCYAVLKNFGANVKRGMEFIIKGVKK